jgi:carboxyl-terminal processing protease
MGRLEENHLYRVLKVFAIIMLLAIFTTGGFAAGILIDRNYLVPSTPSAAGTASESGETAVAVDNSKIRVGLIQEAFDTITKNYADRETLEKTDLTYGAIAGMVDSLGDTGHSRFLSPEMVASEARSIEGEYEGIGALLNVNENGNPIILAPMDNSPALKAGLLPGDIILKVDGVDVSHATLDEVVQRVVRAVGHSGDPDGHHPCHRSGARCYHHPREDRGPERHLANASRDKSRSYPPGSFSKNVASDMKTAIQEAKKHGATGILRDLRNNSGGVLDEATEVIGQFIKDGIALKVKDAQGTIREIPAARNGIATDIPMVVLINQGSASAAEITAGALQDYNRARLVGETTFGTGTVLNQFSLSDGSAILLATELWLTPNGRVIWHQGIKPDVEVKLPAMVTPSVPESERDLTAEGLKNLEDTQLKKGLEILLQQMEQ